MADLHDLRRRAAGAARALDLRSAAAQLRGTGAAAPLADPPQDYTGWLRATAGEELDRLDATADLAWDAFRGLDDDVWAMLLSRDFTGWPALQRFLPDVPPADLQQLWNGASGARLAGQTMAFVRKLRDRVAAHGRTPLHEAKVLDHGIGWGRIARHLARDVAPAALHGTDPAPFILDVCRRDRVPALLHQSGFLPETLPVDGVDVAYAFSVFTHLSERATSVNLDALHAAIVPGGLLVATVRPPAYAHLVDGLHEPRGAEHVFLPHAAEASHHQWDGGEMTYGEAIVAVEHVRRTWAPRFELLDAAPLVGDLHQVVLTLRRSA